MVLDESVVKEELGLRRHMDKVHEERLTEMSASMHRLQEAFERTLREAAQIQTNQALSLEKITALNERLLRHSVEEDRNREKLLESVSALFETVSKHGAELKVFGESILVLKGWTMLLATALGALAAGGVGWIIQHLQNSVH